MHGDRLTATDSEHLCLCLGVTDTYLALCHGEQRGRKGETIRKGRGKERKRGMGKERKRKGEKQK